MQRSIVVIALVALSLNSAGAAILCEVNAGANKGTVKVEAGPNCQARETKIDPVALGLQGPQGLQGPVGPPHRGHKDHKDLWDHKDQTDHKEKKDHRDRRGCPVRSRRLEHRYIIVRAVLAVPQRYCRLARPRFAAHMGVKLSALLWDI